ALEIPTGTVADLFGRRASVVLGSFVAGIGAFVYASTPRIAVFLCAEVLFAVAFTLMSGADEALVYDTLEQLHRGGEAKRTFARLESFKLAGIVIGALSGGVIASQLGLTAPMLLQVLPSLVSGAVALTLVEPGAAPPRQLRHYARLLLSGVRHFRSHAILRVLTLDMIGTASLAWLIIWMYQPQLERVAVGLAFFGAVHASMCIGQILVLGNIPRLEALVGSTRRYLLMSAAVPGLAFIALAWSTHAITVVVAIVVAASIGLSRPTLFMSYLNKYIPSEQRATVLSTISMLRTLAIAVLNPVAGWLADWSTRGALVTFGVGAIVLALFTRIEE